MTIIHILLIILIIFLFCNRKTEGVADISPASSEELNILSHVYNDSTAPSLNVNGHIKMNNPDQWNLNWVQSGKTLALNGKKITLKSLGNGTLVMQGSGGDGNLTVGGNLTAIKGMVFLNHVGRSDIKRIDTFPGNPDNRNIPHDELGRCPVNYYVCGVHDSDLYLGVDCCSFN
jgi:hypothetical protein